MSTDSEEIEKRFVINTRYGLHARPATLFVKTIANFDAEVEVSKDDLSVDGKSVLELMILAAAPGEEVTVTIRGADAAKAMAAVEALFESRFGEA